MLRVGGIFAPLRDITGPGPHTEAVLTTPRDLVPLATFIDGLASSGCSRQAAAACDHLAGRLIGYYGTLQQGPNRFLERKTVRVIIDIRALADALREEGLALYPARDLIDDLVTADEVLSDDRLRPLVVR